QDAASALQVDVFQQRVADGRFGSLTRTVRTAGAASAHHRHAHFAHHGLNVGEVDVDHARTLDDVGDAAHGAGQHVVGLGEGGQQAGILAEDGQQFFVGDGDQRVDALGQRADALIGNDHALLALERERTSDHGHGEDAQLLGDLGDHRSGAGTGATAHAGGDEHHVGALQHFGDALAVFQSGLTTGLRIGASTQALGHARAELQHGARTDVLQRLRIGVGADELDAFDVADRHVVDRVTAATADTDDLDHRTLWNVIY